jgi:hypothetical protein
VADDGGLTLTGGLAFYNCGPASGRSQPHKHLQVVPHYAVARLANMLHPPRLTLASLPAEWLPSGISQGMDARLPCWLSSATRMLLL